MFDKNFTCCFTGHREIAAQHITRIPKALDRILRILISQGYHTFVSGGALGFDTMASQAVLKLKKEFPHIRLKIVAPYAGQSDRWGISEQIVYERIREAADDYICLSAGYTPTCMKKRNQYLVDMSDVCIAYCIRERSGSAQTVNFAVESGLKLVDVVDVINKL